MAGGSDLDGPLRRLLAPDIGEIGDRTHILILTRFRKGSALTLQNSQSLADGLDGEDIDIADGRGLVAVLKGNDDGPVPSTVDCYGHGDDATDRLHPAVEGKFAHHGD